MFSTPRSNNSSILPPAIMRVFISLPHQASQAARFCALAALLCGAWLAAPAATANVAHPLSAPANFGTLNVGSPSPATTVTFTFAAAGTIGAPAVVTQGAPNLDFTDAGTGTCTTNGTTHEYNIGDNCTVDVIFTPRYPGPRYGAVVLSDSSGNVIATGYLQGTGLGPLVNFALVKNEPYLWQTSQTNIASGLKTPTGLAVDGSGNVYIADSGDGTVFKETLSGGGYTQSTVVTGVVEAGEIAVDGAGNIYVVQGNYFTPGQNVVLKETPTATGYIETSIGSGMAYAEIGGVAVDGGGNVYISDPGNKRIVKETPSATGYTQTTIISSGLNYPEELAVDGSGNLYFVDGQGNDLFIEQLSNGVYTRHAINQDISGSQGIVVDGNGNVYANTAGYDQLEKNTLTASGYISSFIGNIPPSVGALALDSAGNIYIAIETGSILKPSSVVAKEDFVDPPSFSFASTDVGATSAAQRMSIQNFGNAPLTLPVPATGSNPSIPANFTLGGALESACSLVDAGSVSPGTLGPNAFCQMSIRLAPAAVGTLTGSLAITDNSLNVSNAMQTIQLSGVGKQGIQTINFVPILTATALTTVNLSATASSGLLVSFASTTQSVCTVSRTTASLLTSGNCTIQASQAGSADYLAAPTVSQTFAVQTAPQAINFKPVPGGRVALETVNLSATAASGLPVSFSSNSPTQCTVSGNTASLLAGGYCPIVASAPGNNIYSPGSALQEILVAYAPQTIIFAPIPNQIAATTVNLIASASSGLTVTFASATPTVCMVNGTTASLISSGVCEIEATQAGSAVYSAAKTVSREFGVGHASQTITFAAIPSQTAASTLNMSPSASSGLPVTLTSSTPAVCTVSGTTASLFASGACAIQATQSGNDEYFAAPAITHAFFVAHAAQTITFAAIPSQTASTTLNLIATASSNLPVSFTSDSPGVCTVSGTTASLIAGGSCIIWATQPGNQEYLAAPAVAQQFSVAKLSQAITFTAIPTQTAATSLNLTASASSGLPVSFASLTPAVCTVSGTTASLIAYGTCTIQASQAGNNVYFAASAKQSFGVAHATQTITFAAIPSQTAGTTLTLSATASSSLAVDFASTTPEVCTVAENTASLIASGTCTIKATQAGNDEYFAAPPVSRSFTVTQ
jgi:hypothetical protein